MCFEDQEKYSSDEDDFPNVDNERCKITFDDVSKWVKSTRKHVSRLAWFEVWVHDSVFHTKIPKSLKSLRTTGSIQWMESLNL